MRKAVSGIGEVKSNWAAADKLKTSISWLNTLLTIFYDGRGLAEHLICGTISSL